MALVSIIVPVYNTEKYLKKSLDSLSNQTLKDIEIICIDDGSTDGSPEILRERAEKDGRFIVITEPNSGQGTARNRGIDISTGEYIGFVDSDDLVSNDYFEILYSNAVRLKADISATNNPVHLYENGGLEKMRINYFPVPKSGTIETIGAKQKFILKGAMIWNKIYRAKLIKENSIGFSTVARIGEDSIFDILSAIYANRMALTDKATYYYRQRDNSVTHHKNRKSLLLISVYEELLDRFSSLDISFISKLRWKRAIRAYAFADMANEMGCCEERPRNEFASIARIKFPGFGGRSALKQIFRLTNEYQNGKKMRTLILFNRKFILKT
ncbi:MAG: glycosyltransferase [Helicobacteraceae bacterium]|jgi:glycosyltransferase involved in cell wall biosynthesis|nr:glycosyltransferase [Helicobacteraceae bacterium]